ncbi:STAS domain-containing protein [Streptomyces sp. H10-C2]|uniref:STAS domain-containing protein n=1 Tax=unclassified Streptomyces TaxID=2593676 RepID=UPI0024B883C3|nr:MULTISPECIES: STAS domain-containing protein [unclassified Streptomyces]MDJ0346662.1 STAS domain-containing protein [Streptomyces sp. PH10-H1]MDJ0375101.1 STAS domain-containing protein [Streptomyces sp. H10-C2]
MDRLQVRPLLPASGGLAVLAVSGELDLDSRATLDAAVAPLTDAGYTQVVLDCGRLTFCDSAGLNCLLIWHQRLEDAGGTLVLADLTAAVTRLLKLTGTDQVFVLADNRDQARQRLLPPSSQ